MRSRPVVDRGRSPRAAAALLCWATALVGCASPEPAPTPCPAQLGADAARARRIREALGSTARGREQLRRADAGPPLTICVGRVDEPGITPERVVLLDARDDDAENAARLGHLLLHANEGLPMDPGRGRGRSCDERVAEALQLEARAHALETELRRDLGVTAPRFGFEDAFWAAPPARRVDAIRAWLEVNPHGGGGVPGFVDAYRRACDRGR